MGELLKLLASLAMVELRGYVRRRRAAPPVAPATTPWTFQDAKRVNDIAHAAGPARPALKVVK